MMKAMVMRLAVALVAAWAAPASSQQLIGAYTAVIGPQDLRNSRGQPLTEPWQILRQDRANFHRFGIRQPGDESDPFFGAVENRAAMERMVMRGGMDPAVARAILSGGARIAVRIYSFGDGTGRIDVSLAGAPPAPVLPSPAEPPILVQPGEAPPDPAVRPARGDPPPEARESVPPTTPEAGDSGR